MAGASPAKLPSNHLANFDYIRLAAATAVIFSHSFLIADGTTEHEPFFRWGLLGVLVFFTISGYLITRSAHERASLSSYCLSRALRIYPALICCAAFCAAVLGSIYTQMPLLDYWMSNIPLHYVVDTAVMPKNGWSVPSVVFYQDGGFLGEGMNGSLWSIPQELFCYVIVGVLLYLRLMHRWVFAGLALLSLYFIFMTYPSWPRFLADFTLVSPSFALGAAIYFLSGGKTLPAWPLLPCLLLGAAVLIYRLDFRLFPLYGCYPILWLACGNAFRLPSLKSFGDISYGVYLYGWPMQQVARSFFDSPPHWSVIFVGGLSGAAVAGYLSWHLVEKRALRLKGKAPGPGTSAARLSGSDAGGVWASRPPR